MGIESARDELVPVLLDKSSTRMSSWWGKTTPVQQVYDHLKGSFQSYAWVEVPQRYGREEKLRTLIIELFESNKTSVPVEIHTMGLRKLISTLREFLKGNECLVIFDGVWKEAFWGDREHALVNDKVGRKILITTRKMKVAVFCKSLSPVLSMRCNVCQKRKLGNSFVRGLSDPMVVIPRN